MAGLVPAIHVLDKQKKDVDARHKAGHDDVKNGRGAIRYFFTSEHSGFGGPNASSPEMVASTL
jgi:hypothetical protein